MAELAAADLRAALDFVAEAGAHEDLDSFRPGILPGLHRLVPCDLVGYNEVEPGGGALVVTYPEPLPATGAELARLAHFRAAAPGGLEPPPLTVEAERGQLTIAASAATDGELLLILEEEPVIAPERLRGLGLTPRQAEVLALLARGRGVAGIAAELFLSPATVRKHLEHVYARLGVHSRAEAVAAAHASAPGVP